jgi:hypothetical protein
MANREAIRSCSARATPQRTGDLEKGLYIAALSFAIALAALLAHGAAYSTARSRPALLARHSLQSSDPSAVYGRAMVLSDRYRSRPYWHKAKLTIGSPTSRETADLAIEHLIPCESGGRAVDRLDTNGKMSYGILQFQDWPEWERVSGLSGDPDDPRDAIRMAEWGIEHGMIDHWTCARILGEI